jgi:hypothetical protein
VRAQLLGSQGETSGYAEAIGSLAGVLANAPPGFAAWTLPVEPFLAQLSTHQQFTGVLAALAARAV